MKNLENNELLKEFISYFKIAENGFTDCVSLEDLNFGFSAKRLFKGDYYSIVYIFILDEDLENDNLIKKPLFIRLSFVLKRNNEFVVIDEAINGKDIPINLESLNDYYVNLKECCITFYKDKKEIMAEEILKELYELHIKPSKKIKGIFIRNKIRFLKLFPSFIFGTFLNVFYCLLILVAGQKYKYSPFQSDRMVEPILKINNENSNLSKEFSIFGYPASFWSIMSYSGFHLIFFNIFFFYELKPSYLRVIFSNSFLTSIYTVFSFGFFGILLPIFLKSGIHWSMNKYYNALFKRIKL